MKLRIVMAAIVVTTASTASGAAPGSRAAFQYCMTMDVERATIYISDLGGTTIATDDEDIAQLDTSRGLSRADSEWAKKLSGYPLSERARLNPSCTLFANADLATSSRSKAVSPLAGWTIKQIH